MSATVSGMSAAEESRFCLDLSRNEVIVHLITKSSAFEIFSAYNLGESSKLTRKKSATYNKKPWVMYIMMIKRDSTSTLIL